MKNTYRFATLIAISMALASCNTDDDADTITCADLTDDAVIMDGKKLDFMPSICVCVSTDHYGAMWYTHIRDITYGSGNSLILASMNITLSSTPAAGQTEVFTVDNGMRALATTAAPAGLATVRINNFELDPEIQENFFGDEDSGTIQATADANGNITLNFDNVQLLRSGGLLTERYPVCGQNIICH